MLPIGVLLVALGALRFSAALYLRDTKERTKSWLWIAAGLVAMAGPF